MTLPAISTLPTAPTASDDSATFNTRAFALVAAFAGMVSELNLYTAALPSVITGTDFSGTSTTSVLIATGSKSFTTQTGKQFQIGQSVRVASTVSPSNYMDGQVTAYNSGTGALVVEVSAVGGSGTLAVWTISLAVGGGGSSVTLTGIETLTNKTLTAPVIATMVSGGLTVTVPAATDTLVGKATTDTLTNKTINFAAGGNVGKINGNTFAASVGTATITFFNSSDTVVGRATTDTLTNKTLTSPAINGGTLAAVTLSGAGTITADNTVTDTGTIAAASPGFRGLPVSGQTQGSLITLALTDAAKLVPNTTGGWTIPANGTTAFPIGSWFTLYNDSAATQTVAITTDTLRLHGTATAGTRTVAIRGFCTVVKVKATEWVTTGDVT